MYRFAIVCAIVLSFGMSLNAEILRVPDEYERIMLAVDAAEDGDMIVVSRGEYAENVDFSGKQLVITSEFFFSEDYEDIEETIISGNDFNRSIVRMRSDEPAGTALIGFTIRDGDTDIGGGIFINNVEALLSDLIVENNRSEFDGGGIFITGNSPVTIRNSIIKNNETHSRGGGIAAYDNGALTIDNVQIIENISFDFGAGIFLRNGAEAFITNCTFERNEGGAIWGQNNQTINIQNSKIDGNVGRMDNSIVYLQFTDIRMDYVQISNNYDSRILIHAPWDINSYHFNNVTIVDNNTEYIMSMEMATEVRITNSIIWGYGDDNIGSINISNSFVNYCSIQDGQDRFAEVHDWGEGNIDADPNFVNRDEKDYNLNDNSPCIDAGDPEGELDADESRKDIGAIPFKNRYVVMGEVRDVEDMSPLSDVKIEASNGQFTQTDQDGKFSINLRPYDVSQITYHKAGYYPIVSDLDRIIPGDTLRVEITLYSPNISFSSNEITADMYYGQEESTSISLENSGNANIIWKAEIDFDAPFEAQSFERKNQIDLSQNVFTNTIRHVIKVHDFYYAITYNGNWNGYPLLVFNNDGDLVRELQLPPDLFDQPSVGGMTWDGELIWINSRNVLYGFNLEAELVSQIALNDVNLVTWITWDAVSNHFWGGTITSNIFSFDRNGNKLEPVVSRNGYRIYGLAVNPNPDEEERLHIATHIGGQETYELYKLNPYSDEINWTYLHTFDFPFFGLYIFSELHESNLNFVTVTNIGSNRKIIHHQLSPRYEWLTVTPSEGIVNADESEELTIELKPFVDDSYGDSYTADIVITSTIGHEFRIPVSLSLSLSVDDNERQLPTDFTIESIYPNPFNSFSTVRFALPSQSQVKLAIYDINGRLVQHVVQKQFEAGVHSVAINGQSLASGVYFVRLDAGDIRLAKKIALVK